MLSIQMQSNINTYICGYINYITVKLSLSVPMAKRSKASTVFGRSNIGIAGSNPSQGMDVCLRLSVL
jgi:hypothetical protein